MSASKSSHRSNRMPDKDEVELEAMLFGTVAEEDTNQERGAETRSGEDALDDDTKRDETGGPAWVDEDDEDVHVDISVATQTRKLQMQDGSEVLSGKEYARRLREQYAKINGSQDWALSALKRAKSVAKRRKDTLGTVRSSSSSSSAAQGDAKEVEIHDDEGRRKRRRKSGDGDPDEGDDDDDDDLRTSASDILGGNAHYLRPRKIEMTRLVDANIRGRSDAVVRAVEFHPTRPLLLTGGFDRKLRLFEIDGKRNNMLQSLVLPDMPIHRAFFSGADGSEIICAGRRPFFYYYDLVEGRVVKVPRVAGPHKQKSLETFAVSPDGKYIAFLGGDGYVILVSGRTKKWICDMKLNGSVRAASFSPNSEELLTIGGDGEMYRWSMRTRRCIGRHVDEGNLSGTAIAMSPSGGRYAIGSSSGVVNIYDAKSAARASAKTLIGANVPPLKAVMNLTTPIDRIQFNHDSNIMAISSQRVQDALKLVHMPTMTTFANWPTANTPLGFVTSMSFSARSRYFAVGNHKGNVILYRLRHYDARA